MDPFEDNPYLGRELRKLLRPRTWWRSGAAMGMFLAAIFTSATPYILRDQVPVPVSLAMGTAFIPYFVTIAWWVLYWRGQATWAIIEELRLTPGGAWPYARAQLAVLTGTLLLVFTVTSAWTLPVILHAEGGGDSANAWLLVYFNALMCCITNPPMAFWISCRLGRGMVTALAIGAALLPFQFMLTFILYAAVGGFRGPVIIVFAWQLLTIVLQCAFGFYALRLNPWEFARSVEGEGSAAPA